MRIIYGKNENDKIMKKEYKQPKMRIVPVKATQMLCSSPDSYKFDSIQEDNYTGQEGIDVD